MTQRRISAETNGSIECQDEKFLTCWGAVPGTGQDNNNLKKTGGPELGDEGSRDAPGSDVKNLRLLLPLGKEQRRQRVGAGPGNCLHPIAEKTGGRACGEAGGSTWSGPEAHQCRPSTWPLERLPRQTHLPRALGAATGGYCAGRRAGGRDRTPGNPDPRPCAPQGPPLPPAASCSSLFVCRGLHAQIELPFFFFFPSPVSSAVSRNSPPV